MLKSVWKTFFRISANNNKHFGRHASIANPTSLAISFLRAYLIGTPYIYLIYI